MLEIWKPSKNDYIMFRESKVYFSHKLRNININNILGYVDYEMIISRNCSYSFVETIWDSLSKRCGAKFNPPMWVADYNLHICDICNAFKFLCYIGETNVNTEEVVIKSRFICAKAGIDEIYITFRIYNEYQKIIYKKSSKKILEDVSREDYIDCN